MPSGDRYAGFFNQALLGSRTFRDHIFEAGRDFVRGSLGPAFGEAVFNPGGTATGITASADIIGNRRLTLTQSNKGLAGSGELLKFGNGHALDQDVEPGRTITKFDPAWFTLLPYENANGTTYRVYATRAKYPVDVGIARNGSRGYSSYVDVVGIEVTPDAVDITGDVVKLRFGAALTALGIQPWDTTNTQDPNWSYDCAVYLDTDTAGVEIADDDPDVAIAYGAKLTKFIAGGNSWEIDISAIADGRLGQSAPPSSTASHYKVTIFGPIITTTNLDLNEDYIHIGTVSSTIPSETISTGAQIVMAPLNSFIAGWGLDHVATVGDPDLGKHTQITADPGALFNFKLDHATDARMVFDNIGAGGFIIEISDRLRIGDILPFGSNPIEFIFDQPSLASLDIRNAEATNLTRVTVDGEIAAGTRMEVGAAPSTSGHRMYQNQWFVDGITTMNWGSTTPIDANWNLTFASGTPRNATWTDLNSWTVTFFGGLNSDVVWSDMDDLTWNFQGTSGGNPRSIVTWNEVNRFIVNRDTGGGADPTDSIEFLDDWPLIRFRIDGTLGEFRVGTTTTSWIFVDIASATIDLGASANALALFEDIDVSSHADFNTFTVSGQHIGTLESDEFNWDATRHIETYANMEALCELVDNGKQGVNVGAGSWSGAASSAIASLIGFEGQNGAFRFNPVLLTNGSVGDYITIKVPIVPGCTLDEVIMIAEADVGDIDVEIDIYRQDFAGTGGRTGVDSDTQNVQDNGRKKVTYSSLTLLGTVHGMDHASGSRWYSIDVVIAALNGGATDILFYDFQFKWAVTDVLDAAGNSDG